MNAAESKDLKKGIRVYWHGDAADCGTITENSGDAVTITWNNGHIAVVHHGEMREILRAPISTDNAQSLGSPPGIYIVSGELP